MNSWVFIDKPKNITSFEVIKRLKKILNIKKIGHSGTLDPFATGILAIAFGEATKSIPYFNQNKVYKFNVVFGEMTDTDDITGKTIKKSNIVPTLDEINQCIRKFIGKHTQIPPQYSAVKVNGKRAYKLARNNQKFALKAKDVFIENIKCLGIKNMNEYSFVMECSTGTYVRSVARDLGKMLGTYAYVSELRRVKIGKIEEKDIILLDKFEELVHIGDHFEVMHSIREVLDDIPAVLIDQELSHKFRNGLSFEYISKKSENDYLLIETNTNFVGIGKAIEDKIKPVRVFNL
jgi:tRNA pseudouridine55 synthase